MIAEPCKYWEKKGKGFCKAANVKTDCKNNLWYCDWIRERRGLDNGDNSTGVEQKSG